MALADYPRRHATSGRAKPARRLRRVLLRSSATSLKLRHRASHEVFREFCWNVRGGSGRL